jgi:hypothetical protein
MRNEGQFKKLEDRVNVLRARPTVGMFIDLDSLLLDIEEAFDASTYDNIRDYDIAEVVIRVAQSAGRPGRMAVYYSADDDDVELQAWRSRNIIPINTPKDGYTKDDINLPIVLDAYEGALAGSFDVCILVVGQTDYTALGRRLMERGITVLLVSNYPPSMRTLPRDNCAYIPLRSLFSDVEAVAVDPDSFDYDQLVRLLYESEKRMPFVAVRYFIRDVMWRLGEGFKNTTTCQRIFQGAKDRELVEVYKHPNVDPRRKEVSACKLVRTNAKVISIIDEVKQKTQMPGNDEEQEPQVRVHTESSLSTDHSGNLGPPTESAKPIL